MIASRIGNMLFIPAFKYIFRLFIKSSEIILQKNHDGEDTESDPKKKYQTNFEVTR